MALTSGVVSPETLRGAATYIRTFADSLDGAAKRLEEHRIESLELPGYGSLERAMLDIERFKAAASSAITQYLLAAGRFRVETARDVESSQPPSTSAQSPSTETTPEQHHLDRITGRQPKKGRKKGGD